jgi:hypothetical protein
MVCPILLFYNLRVLKNYTLESKLCYACKVYIIYGGPKKSIIGLSLFFYLMSK